MKVSHGKMNTFDIELDNEESWLPQVIRVLSGKHWTIYKRIDC